jgi:hypothetical protein
MLLEDALQGAGPGATRRSLYSALEAVLDGLFTEVPGR